MSPAINGRYVYNRILHSKWMETWIPEDPSAAAAKLALVSTITKDALGCGIYTWQSLHNKKIPEDKRKFVAANDFSNGIYNVAIPWILGNKITEASAKLFGAKFENTLFDRGSAQNLFNKLQKAGISCTEEGVYKVLNGNCKSIAKAGMATVFTLILSQIFCKRVVTPLLATPTADYIKKGMEKYDEYQAKKAKQNGDTVSFSGNENNQNETQKTPPLYIVTPKTFDAFDQLITKPIKYKKAEAAEKAETETK